MVYGMLNLINFAHGDVLMIGAMTALSLILFLQQRISRHARRGCCSSPA